MGFFNNFSDLYNSNTTQNISVFNYNGKEDFLKKCTVIMEDESGNEDYDFDELWARRVGGLIRREVKTLDDCKKVFADFGDTTTIESNDKETIFDTANLYLYHFYENYSHWYLNGDNWNFDKISRQHYGISQFDKETNSYIPTQEDEAIYKRVGEKQRHQFEPTDWENETDWEEYEREEKEYEENMKEAKEKTDKWLNGEISVEEWLGW